MILSISCLNRWLCGAHRTCAETPSLPTHRQACFFATSNTCSPCDFDFNFICDGQINRKVGTRTNGMLGFSQCVEAIPISIDISFLGRGNFCCQRSNEFPFSGLSLLPNFQNAISLFTSQRLLPAMANLLWSVALQPRIQAFS